VTRAVAGQRAILFIAPQPRGDQDHEKDRHHKHVDDGAVLTHPRSSERGGRGRMRTPAR
jgi:hypothetical protein